MQKVKLSILMILMIGVTLAGCKSKAVEEGVAVDEQSIGDGSGGAGSVGLGGDEGALGQALPGDIDPLSQRVIYFEYDSTAIDADSQAIVEAHAAYLNNNYQINVVLEGHADERGTREYNLALGEGRSKAVSTMMQALGIGPERIQTISYGEERPSALGSDEASWSLNRRVEILYSN
ncbi:MAG: peptidoglycan-associated lipoprotein Pal [Gammaproteobacteria bacterium]|nr:peptidoglycan-associated lipoprotein Pal [Gammaproteobacteria bacterium]MDH3468445.1 peptidoglycan-associated lipoprotein Pal [Gammaproteobacteria bacterium]